MGNFKEGDVWFVGFPLEEDSTQIINRPVVVLDEDKLTRCATCMINIGQFTKRAKKAQKIPDKFGALIF